MLKKIATFSIMATLFAFILQFYNKIWISEKQLWKEFICTYANVNISWKLIGQTVEQIMIYDKNKNWVILDRKSFKKNCSALPFLWLEMLSWYNHLSWNFTK